jgi:hypothetical protein
MSTQTKYIISVSAINRPRETAWSSELRSDLFVLYSSGADRSQRTFLIFINPQYGMFNQLGEFVLLLNLQFRLYVCMVREGVL